MLIGIKGTLAWKAPMDLIAPCLALVKPVPVVGSAGRKHHRVGTPDGRRDLEMVDEWVDNLPQDDLIIFIEVLLSSDERVKHGAIRGTQRVVALVRLGDELFANAIGEAYDVRVVGVDVNVEAKGVSLPHGDVK